MLLLCVLLLCVLLLCVLLLCVVLLCVVVVCVVVVCVVVVGVVVVGVVVYVCCCVCVVVMYVVAVCVVVVGVVVVGIGVVGVVVVGVVVYVLLCGFPSYSPVPTSAERHFILILFPNQFEPKYWNCFRTYLHQVLFHLEHCYEKDCFELCSSNCSNNVVHGTLRDHAVKLLVTTRLNCIKEFEL